MSGHSNENTYTICDSEKERFKLLSYNLQQGIIEGRKIYFQKLEQERAQKKLEFSTNMMSAIDKLMKYMGIGEEEFSNDDEKKVKFLEALNKVNTQLLILMEEDAKNWINHVETIRQEKEEEYDHTTSNDERAKISLKRWRLDNLEEKAKKLMKFVNRERMDKENDDDEEEYLGLWWRGKYLD
jgi:hypothetical protein